jgi:hypothetical protein
MCVKALSFTSALCLLICAQPTFGSEPDPKTCNGRIGLLNTEMIYSGPIQSLVGDDGLELITVPTADKNNTVRMGKNASKEIPFKVFPHIESGTLTSTPSLPTRCEDDICYVTYTSGSSAGTFPLAVEFTCDTNCESRINKKVLKTSIDIVVGSDPSEQHQLYDPAALCTADSTLPSCQAQVCGPGECNLLRNTGLLGVDVGTGDDGDPGTEGIGYYLVKKQKAAATWGGGATAEASVGLGGNLTLNVTRTRNVEFEVKIHCTGIKPNHYLAEEGSTSPTAGQPLPEGCTWEGGATVSIEWAEDLNVSIGADFILAAGLVNVIQGSSFETAIGVGQDNTPAAGKTIASIMTDAAALLKSSWIPDVNKAFKTAYWKENPVLFAKLDGLGCACSETLLATPRPTAPFFCGEHKQEVGRAYSMRYVNMGLDQCRDNPPMKKNHISQYDYMCKNQYHYYERGPRGHCRWIGFEKVNHMVEKKIYEWTYFRNSTVDILNGQQLTIDNSKSMDDLELSDLKPMN